MNPTHELDDLLAGLAEVEEPTPEPSLAPALIGPWPAKLSFDVAFGESDDVIRAKYNLSEPTLQSIYLNPTFRKEVSEKQAVLREEGITFKTKAKMQPTKTSKRTARTRQSAQRYPTASQRPLR